MAERAGGAVLSDQAVTGVIAPDVGVLMDSFLLHQRALQDAARQKRLAEEDRAKEGWYASSLGNCYRQQYMQRLGRPATRGPDAKAFRTFAWGDMVEDFVRKVYSRAGLVLETQTAYRLRDLAGRADLLLRYPPEPVESIPDDVKAEWSPEWLAMLAEFRADVAQAAKSVPDGTIVGDEVKSANSNAMRYLFKEGKPRDGHRLQVGSYMLVADALAGTPDAPPAPDHWQIEYVGKDSTGTLRFKVDGDAAADALNRLTRLEEIWDAQPKPSEVECECKGWMITYCRYANDDGTCCGHTWASLA